MAFCLFVCYFVDCVSFWRVLMFGGGFGREVRRWI